MRFGNCKIAFADVILDAGEITGFTVDGKGATITADTYPAGATVVDSRFGKCYRLVRTYYVPLDQVELIGPESEQGDDTRAIGFAADAETDDADE